MMTPEEYARRHQKAFRAAFDFLNAHFPPADEPEWWDQAAKDCSAASIKNGEDRLTIGLLVGVMEYLESEIKQRRKEHATADT